MHIPLPLLVLVTGLIVVMPIPEAWVKVAIFVAMIVVTAIWGA